MDGRREFVLQVYEVLRKHSNENNFLTQQDIIDYLDKDFNVHSERKSIAKAINAINSVYEDCVVKSDSRKGFAITERNFSKDEIIPIMMAIYSFKGFSSQLTNQITEKLKSDYALNEHFPASHTVTNSLKNENKEVIYNFSIISEAIANKKLISYSYTNEAGKKNNRTICPHYIFVSQEEFRLLATFNNSPKAKFYVYSLDKMTDVKIVEDSIAYKLQDIEKYKDFDIDKYLNEHLYYFSKPAITAKIKMKSESNKSQIIKWFGKQAKFLANDIVEITNDVDSLYFWLKDYAEYLEILEPEELRNKLYEYGQKLIDTYKK